MLDVTERWDREFSQDEQTSLAFARIVLQKPRWVLVDDTFGSLDDETLERVTDVFSPTSSSDRLINIGRAAQARDPFFSRVLHLEKTAGKRMRAVQVTALPATARGVPVRGLPRRTSTFTRRRVAERSGSGGHHARPR
jgi:ABC-type uncharacterized transport system fused permease/ATPase subunit